jgi:hypothetical protein
VLDDVSSALPRVALVFGDSGSAAHLREAVSGHVQIVYEASAADFDAARLAAERAGVALVNLDGWDWLESLEARLAEAGVAVVFNDPEISDGLEGWARARWLRHLVAKLEGHGDFDPPRPHGDVSGASMQEEAGPAAATRPPATDSTDVAERPLSPSEIASLTADFAMLQETRAPVASSDDVATEAVAPSDPQVTAALDVPDAVESTAAGSEADEAPVSASTMTDGDQPRSDWHAAEIDGAEAGALDVDTEALSAMIDARLAQTEEHDAQAFPETPVWRLVEDGHPPADGIAMGDAPVEPVVDVRAAAPEPAAPVEDADVLKGLPALDEWQLVDPEAPLAAVESRPEAVPAPALPDSLAGLELIPMEIPTSVARQSDEPIERWMHDVSESDKAAQARKPESKGDHA